MNDDRDEREPTPDAAGPPDSGAAAPGDALPSADDPVNLGVAVPLGQAMPVAAEPLPVLQSVAAAPPASGADMMLRHSTVGEGMSFQGHALHEGVFTVAGEFTGQLDAGRGRLTITETGHLVGDARALTIAVFGRSEGLLDATGGRVSLHETAAVSGRVRYAQLQVNGADLNAQLERARGDGEAGTR